MKRAFSITALALIATPAFAQQEETVIDVSGSEVAVNGAILRALDRINGSYVDLDLKPGETVNYERLEIELVECRYPAGQTTTEAFANLKVRDLRENLATFEGWMFASSPALSALDHPRYDVWVLRCNI